MTSRERLDVAMRCGQPDRVPAKVPALPADTPATPDQRRRFEAAHRVVNARMGSWGMEGDTGFFYTAHPDVHYREYRRDSIHDGYRENVQELIVPAGRLEAVELVSDVGLPAYQQQYMIREAEDADILLSMPYVPPRPSSKPFYDEVAKIGDDGVVIVGMVDTIYSVQRLIGSETLAYWSADRRDTLHALCDFFCRRQVDMIRYCRAEGMGPYFGWVGPEICLPPLMGPRDFEDFVMRYDRRLCDAIHEGDGVVWVHSHGSVSKVLEGFVDIGVNCLEPLEPPPHGDLDLADAKRRVGGRLCLEGNFEPYEFDNLTPDAMRERVRRAMADAKEGGGYIVACADGPTRPMTRRSVEALVAFVEAVRDYGEY